MDTTGTDARLPKPANSAEQLRRVYDDLVKQNLPESLVQQLVIEAAKYLFSDRILVSTGGV